MTFQFTDAVAVQSTRKTRDGYLVVDARIARTGVQVYSGSEMGRPNLDTVRVYRPPEEVFSDAAMASFTHRPVTNDHPSELVSASNWRDHAVGMTGDEARQDEKYVRVPFTLMDQSTIDDVERGKVELSGGYVCQIDWTSGVTPEGEAFDAVQRNIRGNHLAVVQRGRAGAECRIGDSWTANPKPTPTQPQESRRMADTLRSVLVDGITISATDQSAQAIERLQGQLRDSAVSLSAKDTALSDAAKAHASALSAKDGVIDAMKADHGRALSAKDGEMDALKTAHTAALSAKDGEIAGLKAQMPDALALDAMIADRERIIVTARKMLGDSFDPKGKSVADIRRAAVDKRMGDSAKGRDDAYVAAAFDALSFDPAAAVRQPDPVRDAMRGPATHTAGSPSFDGARTAHKEMTDRLKSGWSQTATRGA